MNLYIVRHGQTDWNKEKRLQGQCNIPLNEIGRNEARDVANHLLTYKIERIISSTLDRALETAQIINQSLNVPLSTDQRLIERSFGDYEGKTYDQEQIAYFWQVNDPSNNIEPLSDVFARVKDFLQSIQGQEETTLVVCHGIIAAMIRIILEELTQDYHTLTPHNCEVLSYKIDHWDKIKSRNF